MFINGIATLILPKTLCTGGEYSAPTLKDIATYFINSF
jgi:hypothetical protein